MPVKRATVSENFVLKRSLSNLSHGNKIGRTYSKMLPRNDTMIITSDTPLPNLG
jgi:hypothetical protein